MDNLRRRASASHDIIDYFLAYGFVVGKIGWKYGLHEFWKDVEVFGIGGEEFFLAGLADEEGRDDVILPCMWQASTTTTTAYNYSKIT